MGQVSTFGGLTGMPDVENREYIIPQLIIHGSKKYYHVGPSSSPRYKDFSLWYGYDHAVEYGTSPIGDLDPQQQVKIWRALTEDASVDQVAPGHFDGNPLFCMYIELTDFERTKDGSCSVTIKDAHTCKYPNWDGFQPDNTSFVPDWFEPYWGDPLLIGFGYSFTLVAAICVTAADGFTRKYYNETPLFTRTAPSGSLHGRWFEGSQGGSAHEIKLICRAERSDIVYFGIYMECNCTCNQGSGGGAAGKRFVYGDEITQWFPEVESYIWRKFGSSATEDPVGSRIDSSKLDGRWHLVRPFYTVVSSGSRKVWRSVENEN